MAQSDDPKDLPAQDTPMSMPTAVALPAISTTTTTTARTTQLTSHIQNTPMSMSTPTAGPLPTTSTDQLSSTSQTHAGSAPLLTNPSTTTPSQIPHLTLYYHPLSPFARKVYITAHELSLTSHLNLHKVVVAPVLTPKGFPGWSENNEIVGAHNPINKIPTLVVRDAGVDTEKDEGYAVFDSKVICDYLSSLAGKGEVVKKDANYWKRQTIHRLADQMMDSEILVAYEERIRRPENLYFQAWVDGMRQKIERGFDMLDQAVRDGVLQAWPGSREVGEVDGAEVAVAVALGFMDMRGMKWTEGGKESEREALGWWFGEWKERESWRQSMPEREWKGLENKTLHSPY